MRIEVSELNPSGGAGPIGSHIANRLLQEDIEDFAIYDNFVRGWAENLAEEVKEPRVRIFDVGGDIAPKPNDCGGL